MIIRNEVSRSLIPKFLKSVGERRKNDLPIISLGLGEPDFDVPSSIKDALIQVLKTSKLGYSDPMGLLSLRQKISEKLNNENHINSSPENIIITSGSKQAFTLVCMVMLNPGDEVIIINPSFVSYIPQILISEPASYIKVINIRKSDFSFSIQDIENQISSRTKLLIINSPNNPTGYVLNSSLLQNIYALASERNLYIISDEVYEKLVFSKHHHSSIGSFEKAPKRVITINSLSKSHAMPGWGLGYACFPADLRQRLLALQKHINSNTSTLIQEALDRTFFIDNQYLDEYNARLLKRAEIINKICTDENRISLVQPDAGFYAFLNISETNIDSDTFCSLLIQETGVALTPGIVFGEFWDDHVRISFASPEETLGIGLQYLTQFTRKL
jgi:aspartate aminotransferase